MLSSPKIIVGARDSLLSQRQVEEVYEEIRRFCPDLEFDPLFVKSMGDLDKKTSLRTLDKSDFFTREIDEMVLNGVCRIAIHSAKDLPHPLKEGLYVAALTRGVDSSDSLVIKGNEKLTKGSIVATSSFRREEVVRMLFPEVDFVDIRGTIQERLEFLDCGQVDGVVVAEAALIRLELTHRSRISLPGQAAEMQGRLAVVVRADDKQMRALFSKIHDEESALSGT